MDIKIGASMSNFTGKTAIVTGASRGIGLAIAEKLASQGVSLALVGTNPTTISATAERLAAAYSVKAIGYAVNVAEITWRGEPSTGIRHCRALPPLR